MRTVIAIACMLPSIPKAAPAMNTKTVGREVGMWQIMKYLRGIIKLQSGSDIVTNSPIQLGVPQKSKRSFTKDRRLDSSTVNLAMGMHFAGGDQQT